MFSQAVFLAKVIWGNGHLKPFLLPSVNVLEMNSLRLQREGRGGESGVQGWEEGCCPREQQGAEKLLLRQLGKGRWGSWVGRQIPSLGTRASCTIDAQGSGQQQLKSQVGVALTCSVPLTKKKMRSKGEMRRGRRNVRGVRYIKILPAEDEGKSWQF